MSVAEGTQIGVLAGSFSDATKDTKLNLKAVIGSTQLTSEQAWGTALACAFNEGFQPLIDALLCDGASWLNENVVADAKAVASLMSMNNVYYRFRHMVGKPIYQQMPAKLRMTAIARPKTDKESFELFSLAVSAINGCEQCIKSHEAVLIQHGVSEVAIHDAVRIAAVIRASAVGLRFET